MLFQRKKKKFVITSDVMAKTCLMPFRLKSGQSYPCGMCWVCRQNLEKNKKEVDRKWER